MKENKVAELLVHLRKTYGYTQSDLAEKLDVSFQAVSKWERGENLPDAFTLVELARIYEISVDEILKGKLLEKELSTENKKRKAIIIAIAASMIILAPSTIFMFGVEHWERYVPGMIIIIAISILMIVYASLSEKRIKQYSQVTQEQKRKEEIIYAICVGIFMILGVGFGLFHIAWIVFIFGYAATLIVKK